MGRVNKFTTGVFTDIVGTHKESPLYDQFMKIQSMLNNKPSKKLDGLLKQYNSRINAYKPLFEELSMIETAVMQLRTRDNIEVKDIKLSIVREYIYARIPFHRDDTEGKDIRVIIGLVEKYGSDIPNLFCNNELMEIAKNKLISTMDYHINDNIEKLNKII